jgi:hypothetical protein
MCHEDGGSGSSAEKLILHEIAIIKEFSREFSRQIE